MITIGAGKYRSRKIKVPSYLEVPTKSITRIGLANALSSYLAGASVLDLFAGSGAMGIEFLSRGAKECAFVDIKKEATDIILDNLSSLGIESGSIYQKDYQSALSDFLKEGRKFSIIFIDPPYKDAEAYKYCWDFCRHNDILKDDGILVFEYENKLDFVDEAYFESMREYRYGRSSASIYWRKRK